MELKLIQDYFKNLELFKVPLLILTVIFQLILSLIQAKVHDEAKDLLQM